VCCGVDIDVLLVGPRGWRAAGCGSLSELGADTVTAGGLSAAGDW